MKKRTVFVLLVAFLAVPKTMLYGETFDEIFIRGAKLYYQCDIIETKDRNALEMHEEMGYFYFMGFVSGQDEAFQGLFSVKYPCLLMGNGEMWDLVAIYTVNHPNEKDASQIFEKTVLEIDQGFVDIINATYWFNATKK